MVLVSELLSYLHCVFMPFGAGLLSYGCFGAAGPGNARISSGRRDPS